VDQVVHRLREETLNRFSIGGLVAGDAIRLQDVGSPATFIDDMLNYLGEKAAQEATASKTRIASTSKRKICIVKILQWLQWCDGEAGETPPITDDTPSPWQCPLYGVVLAMMPSQLDASRTRLSNTARPVIAEIIKPEPHPRNGSARRGKPGASTTAERPM
jgi:hypothetical protein